jgi:hypothetical protein
MLDFSTYTRGRVMTLRDTELRRLDQDLCTFRNKIRDNSSQEAVAELLTPTNELVGWVRGEVGRRKRQK